MSTDLTLDTLCVASPDVVSRDIEGEIIIIPLTGGIGDAEDELYSLNDTGRAVWMLLDGRRTLGDVVDLLTQRFDAPRSVVEGDVVGLATEMTARGIVTAISSNTPD